MARRPYHVQSGLPFGLGGTANGCNQNELPFSSRPSCTTQWPSEQLHSAVPALLKFRILFPSCLTLKARPLTPLNGTCGRPPTQVPGRRYPVDIYFTKAPEADYIDAAVQVGKWLLLVCA